MSGERPAAEADEFWLFGYGSLIWKPPPHFGTHLPTTWALSILPNPNFQPSKFPWAIIRLGRAGADRAQIGEFQVGWQAMFGGSGSQDHRGTPEAPGRVVTLISRSYWEKLTDHHDSAPDKVWGVAYRITPDRVAEVKEYLDIREINGYTIHYTPFHPAANVNRALLPPKHHGPIQTLVYIGTPDNEQFVGPQDPQQLAEHIYRSEGPSGLNRDYLWGLEAALDELSPESGDVHVTDLSNRVRVIAAKEATKREQEGGIVEAEMDGKEKTLSPSHPVSAAAVSPEQVLQREQQHHEQHHDFKRASSVDEQEETEKTL